MLGVYLHDVAILVREAANSAASRKMRMVCRVVSDVSEIQSTHIRIGHRLSGARVQRRLVNQLQFLNFELDGQTVASTWVAGVGGRYLDELNWLLPLAPGELWIRDVFVAPAWRGRGVFSAIVSALSSEGGFASRRIWSDVDWSNQQSMRAHMTAGFTVTARVRALDVAGRFRLRSPLPAWPTPVREIDPASRLIWLRGDKLSRHLDLIA